MASKIKKTDLLTTIIPLIGVMLTAIAAQYNIEKVTVTDIITLLVVSIQGYLTNK